MPERINKEMITRIETDLGNILSTENLRYAMNFITYMIDLGIEPKKMEHSYHYIFHHKGVFVCLVVCWKDDNGDNLMFCCWPGELDVNENDKFLISESVKAFARANVKKCFKCGGCEIKPSARKVFDEEHDNVCCNVFHFWKPSNETIENAKILMELLKHNIDDKQCSDE